MSSCIIHIGSHKTGSTSIQNSLEGFRDKRFAYAALDSPNHSLAIYSLFAPQPERHPIHMASGRSHESVLDYVAGIRDKLERAVSTAGDRTLLISGEDISSLPLEGLARLRDYFQSRFDELAIVGYVRPPVGFITSGFQQRVKAGAVVRLNLDQEYPHYKRRFAKFDEVFGRDSVKLWKFDPDAFPSGCAVRDFCARLGISLPRARIVRLNESLPRQIVSLFYTYRKLGPQHGFDIMRAPEGQQLGSLMAAVGNDRFRFSPYTVKPILEKNRADIKWMEARLGQSLRERFGAQQVGDIRRETDLLTPDPAAVDRLLRLLGDAAPENIAGRTPDEVAVLVHAFREKHARRKSRFFGLLQK